LEFLGAPRADSAAGNLGQLANACRPRFRQDAHGRRMGPVISSSSPTGRTRRWNSPRAFSSFPPPSIRSRKLSLSWAPTPSSPGARENASKRGFRIVFDRTYPPHAVEFSTVVRSIKAASPDLVFIAPYSPDSAGLIHSIHDVGLGARMMGGGMIGLQFAALKTNPRSRHKGGSTPWTTASSPRVPGGPDIRYRDSTVELERKLAVGGDGSECGRRKLPTRIDGLIQWTGSEKPSDICRRADRKRFPLQGSAINPPLGRSDGADRRARFRSDSDDQFPQRFSRGRMSRPQILPPLSLCQANVSEGSRYDLSLRVRPA
jgi:hypothetical protein